MVKNRQWDGFNWVNKPKKGSVRKVYVPSSKSWDYEIIGDEKWKPKTPKYFTKKMLEQQLSKNWITSLNTFKEISIHKDNLKDEFENYQNLNDIKKLLTLKKYSYYVVTEMCFFHFYKEYPLKEIYYFAGKLSKLFDDNPNLDRLKYRKHIKIPKSIEKISVTDYGLITYWVFKDVIVFKN